MSKKLNTIIRKISDIFRPVRHTPEVVVSLTSYPPRINNLQPTLESIFQQTRKPDKVVLWLADTEFAHKDVDLPEYLTELVRQGKIVVEWCKDLKPHKKYFYALQKYRDDIVITVDDDLLFAPDTVACLLESYAKFPRAVSAMRTHIMRQDGDKIAAYRDFMQQQNEVIGIPSMRLLGTNGAGSLFPPRLLKFKYFNEKLVEDLCLYTDDLWLKAIEVLSGVPVVQPRRFDKLKYVENSQNVALRYVNTLDGGNDKSMEDICRWADNCFGKGYLLSKIFDEAAHKHFSFKKMCGRNTVLYFSPHQDDELLTMGIDICSAVNNGDDVHIILCTDGRKSGVRARLANKEKCPWHRENHIFELSEDDFVRARDAEFIESCSVLGVAKEKVHILPNRAVDGALTVEAAEEMIKSCLEKYGKKATVCTIYFDNGVTQHKDHKALGKAAYNLRQKGIVRKARFFREPYCAAPAEIKLVRKNATPEIARRIGYAVSAYKRWKPAGGRYAIGYHSVPRDLDNLCKEMITYYFKI